MEETHRWSSLFILSLSRDLELLRVSELTDADSQGRGVMQTQAGTEAGNVFLQVQIHRDT